MFVGVDIGTQSLKTVVLDDDMQLRGEAATAYQPSFPRPGWSEQDPALWETALAQTINRALTRAQVQAGDVRSLGIGGQLDGCIAVGNNGLSLSPCLIWMDRRAETEIIGLPAKEIREKTGIVLDASHMAAKIRWLKDNVAGTKQSCLFHQPSSYLVYRLTGNHVMDHALASTSMLYSLSTQAFDPWLLQLFEIDRSELPAVSAAEHCAGTLNAQGSELTGLNIGTPVAVGTGDDFSTPLGAGVVDPGRLVCVLGTAEVVGAVHPEPIIDDKALVETHAFPGGGFFIENPGWLSGGALTWFKEVLTLKDFKEFDRLAETVTPGCGGVTFLPGLTGTMAPEWVASARGCFYGLTPAHSKEHMMRAVLEGTAFAMRDVAERLGGMGVDLRSILLLGGGASSRVWARIRADLTGLPVEIPALTDTAPIGSALLSAVAAGHLSDLTAATELLTLGSETIEPDASSKPAYDEAHAAYRLLFQSLRPMF
ncbi:MAG: FGGY family carbohydrate kinase [Arenicellales bacterium]|nr:FGGY family carbohydrate kinase [Arenicellales bacterium]